MHQISVIWTSLVINELIGKISTVLEKITQKKSDLKMSVLIMWSNMLFYEEIYTAGKKICTATGSAGSDKSHLYVKVPCQCSQLISKFCPVATTVVISISILFFYFKRGSFWTTFPFPLGQSGGSCVGWEETLVSTCPPRLQRDPRDAARWFATVWSSYVATKSDKKRPTNKIIMRGCSAAVKHFRDQN